MKYCSLEVNAKQNLILPEIVSKNGSTEIWKTECHFNAIRAEGSGKENGVIGFLDNTQSAEGSHRGTSNKSSSGSRNCSKSMMSLLLLESSRRRQITNFEKIIALTCQKCGQKFKNRCMLTRHVIEHKRANNPYRCNVEGCLDSYAEKRKLIGHLNYKHSNLSKEERGLMLMKGDELFEKLRVMSSRGSLACCSGVFPTGIVSSNVVTTGQITASSLSQTETASTSTIATATDNEGPLVPKPANELLSAKNILKNMVEKAKCRARNEPVIRSVKSEMLDSKEFHSTPCISTSTVSSCSPDDAIASLSTAHYCSIVPKRDLKMEVKKLSTVILKRNPEKRSLTVRELLGLDVIDRQKGKFTRNTFTDPVANNEASSKI